MFNRPGRPLKGPGGKPCPVDGADIFTNLEDMRNQMALNGLCISRQFYLDEGNTVERVVWCLGST